MGDDFYCILKLVSGEEILSLISVDDNDGDPIVVLQNPVILELIDTKEKSLIDIDSKPKNLSQIDLRLFCDEVKGKRIKEIIAEIEIRFLSIQQSKVKK